MLWNLVIDPLQKEHLRKSITVEADNWHSALKNGLNKQGVDRITLSNLSCSLGKEERVTVSDLVTRRIYRIEPYTPMPLAPDPEEDKESPQTASEDQQSYPSDISEDISQTSEAKDPSEPLERPSLPEHRVFYSKDESQNDDNGVIFHERLIATEERLHKMAASRLANHYFESLKTMETPDDAQRFISVQIYDHEFSGQSNRPAIAALTWKEWKHSEPDLLFPLSGEEGVTFSKMTPVPEVLPIEQARQLEKEAVEASTDDETPIDDEQVAEGIDEGIITAFERMQEIYTLARHEDAAAFVLDLARELIPCRAGECLLVSTKQYELSVSAVSGDLPEERVGTHLSITQGVVGFVATNSIVVNISDPENDNRYNADDEIRSGVTPKTLLVAPMQFEGELIGVIALLDSERPNGFTQENANILSYLASSFAEFISVSLPSRQADFTDREFEQPSEQVAKKTDGTLIRLKMGWKRP